MGFSRQEYWNGLPFPSPGDLPDPGIEPCLLRLLHLQAGYHLSHQGNLRQEEPLGCGVGRVAWGPGGETGASHSHLPELGPPWTVMVGRK